MILCDRELIQCYVFINMNILADVMDLLTTVYSCQINSTSVAVNVPTSSIRTFTSLARAIHKLCTYVYLVHALR